MKLMVLFLCLFGLSVADNQAESSELSSSKLSSKPSLNSIPSAPAQKTTVLQQQPQYVQYKPQPVGQAQPAMLIIAQPQPGQGSAQHSPLFQQAVQQLLSYYNNNPQAKYQLLQQQNPQYQPQAQQHPHMPSGALHVIPSPQLDQTTAQPQPQPQHQPAQHIIPQHLPIQQHQQQQLPQATYVIPAQSLQTLQGFPGLLAQLTGQQPQHQHLPVPVQYVPQTPQYIPQQIPQFAQHFALPPQFAAGLGQAQFQHQIQPQIQPQHLANVQLQATGPAQQFLGGKAQNVEYQTEKSSSSNYNPVYRTAYVKG